MADKMSDRDEMDQDEMDQGEAGPVLPSGIGAVIGTRNLLIIIVTMPLVFIVVVAGIIMLFGSPRDKDSKQQTARSAVHSTPIEAGDAALAIAASAGSAANSVIVLPDGAAAGAISLDGDQLAVRIDSDEGAAIVIYDLTQSRVVQTVPLRRAATVIEPAPARAASTSVASEPPSQPVLTRVVSEEITAPVEPAVIAETTTDDEPVRSGLTLAAPGFAPQEASVAPQEAGFAQQEESSVVSAVDEPALAVGAILTPPTPSLGSRRTKFVTTPQ